MGTTLSSLPAAPQMNALSSMHAPIMPDDADTLIATEDEAATPDMELAEQLRKWLESPNIAEDLDDETVRKLGSRVKMDYDLDEESRGEWLTKYDQWLATAMQVSQPKTYPWPGASAILYPLLTTASIQFAARAYPSIVRDRNVVRGTVVGDDPGGAKRTRADNVGRHMSWQLLTEMEEWEPQTDKLLHIISIVGTVFRKTYFDPGQQRNVSDIVLANKLCVNYHAKSFETAPRVTELLDLYPIEIEERIRGGLFLDLDYGKNNDAGQDEEAAVTFLEQHRRWDLDGDGYAEPYIITVARDSQVLARIAAAYDMEGVKFGPDHRIRRIEPVPYYTKYGFIPSPDTGVYDIGFGHLLYPINEAINSSLNQMFDAGHLQNAGGGFIGSGLSMNTGAVRFQVGEYKVVNTNGGSLRDNLMPLPFAGPSQVLFELLQFLVNAGKEIAAVKDVMMGDLPGDNVSATTTLAVIEQGLKVFTAIHKRIHRSLKQEFRKLYRLNRLYLPVETGYREGDQWHQMTQADYEAGTGVEPVSDPQMITDMQRLGRAQFLMQFKDDPHFNGMEIRKRILDAALIDNAQLLLASQPPPNPQVMIETAKLHLEGMREQREHQALIIRKSHDKAMEVQELSRAILNLAQARKLDSEVALGWIDQQLNNLKVQLDYLTSADPGDAGSGAGDPGNPVQPMAQPPGQPPGAGLPPGLPPGGGAGIAGPMAQGAGGAGP